MAQSVEIMAGQWADLPGDSYLDAKLTGASQGVRLRALAGDDREVAESRQTDAEVSVRPVPGTGAIRLVAVPVVGTIFAPGTRLGVEVRGGAGAAGDGTQVLVSQVDVGAYTSIELARYDYVPARGWRVTAAGSQEASTFDFLSEDAPTPAVAALDERLYPWIGSGRYALRQARAGSSAARPTGEPWALVVDSSASMRPLFDDAGLRAAVGLLGGIVAELTGNLPTAAGVTGRRQPAWISAAEADPLALVPEVLATTQPASWSLLLPALTSATSKGARVVAVLTDGAPADLEELPKFLEQQPGVLVLMTVATNPAPDVVAEPGTTSPLELQSFDHVSHLPQVRLAALPMGAGAASVDHAATTVAAALAG